MVSAEPVRISVGGRLTVSRSGPELWICGSDPATDGPTKRVVFDVEREAVFLVAGDKASQWNRRYRENIPVAEERHEHYTVERKDKERL